MHQTTDVLTFHLPWQAYLTGGTECFTYSYDYSSFLCPTGKKPIDNALKGEGPSKKILGRWYIHIRKQSNWILPLRVEPGGKSAALPIGSFSIFSQLNPALRRLLSAFKGRCLICFGVWEISHNLSYPGAMQGQYKESNKPKTEKRISPAVFFLELKPVLPCLAIKIASLQNTCVSILDF